MKSQSILILTGIILLLSCGSRKKKENILTEDKITVAAYYFPNYHTDDSRNTALKGEDCFTLDEQLRVIDTAGNFAVKKNIRVAHETHRGRIGFGSVNSRALFAIRPKMKITSDLSHWVCVTESYLEDFEKELDEAIKRTEHIHARVGFTQGSQISDPRSSYWEQEVDFFLRIWARILERQQSIGTEVFTITPEFGPPPYMWINMSNNEPVSSQWDINVFMRDLLKEKFSKVINKRP